MRKGKITHFLRFTVRNLVLSKDFRHYSTRYFSSTRFFRYPIIDASLGAKSQAVKVYFDNDVAYEFPWVFLQDNCTCEDCFHFSSQSRKRLMTNLDFNNRLTSVEICGTLADKIRCTWSDGHEGIFNEEWLKEHCFSKTNIARRVKGFRDDIVFSRSAENIQRGRFDEVLEKPSKLLQLLRGLCKNGVFIVENAPKEVGQLRKLVEKIGFIRTTHYGNEFTVKSKPNASNPAYTSVQLCVHTDLPYYAYPPGIQLLHCIQQYQGIDGANTNLVDGFMVAHQMKKLYPDSYDILSSIPVEFADIGEDYTKFHKIHHSTTFVHSEVGQLLRIVYSNQQLSSVLPIPIENVKPLYEALKLFTTLCYNETNLMAFKLNEGEIVVFDNWRILHGRQAFNAAKGGRHLEGCYIDWDEVYSTMRVLEKLG